MEIEKSIEPTEIVTLAVHQLAGKTEQIKRFSAQARESISRDVVHDILRVIQYSNSSQACENRRLQYKGHVGLNRTATSVATNRLKLIAVKNSTYIDLALKQPVGESGISSKLIERPPVGQKPYENPIGSRKVFL